MRKKIKKMTGELDIVETYVENLENVLKQTLPIKSQGDASKILHSVEQSIQYIRDLFSSSHLNVTHSKKL